MRVPSTLEAVQTAALRATLALPRPVKRLLAGPAMRDDGGALDLDMHVLVRLQQLNPPPPLSIAPPPQARANLRHACRVAAGRRLAMAEVRELAVAGAAGELPARLFVPHGAGDGLLVFLHGGGWVVGDLDTHDEACRWLAAHSGARVLAVAYRRAPEHRFPAPLDDAVSAFVDARNRAGELGASPGRVAVGGDSAGGYLAALVCVRLRESGEAQPALQLLVYPVTDVAGRTPSRRRFARGPILTAPTMDWYEEQLLPPGTDRTNPRLSPLRVDSLADLAPAHVHTAGLDPLRDEGEAYAERLRQAGVPTLQRRHRSLPHGFLSVPGAVPAAGLAVAEMAGALGGALGR